MSFKKLRGVRLPEKKQMLIRSICLNYRDRPKYEQERINRLCEKCGGAHSAALFEIMTTEHSVRSVALKYYISESVLYDIRKRFYESWCENDRNKSS